ncbi:MAG: glycerophosphodiester phosphodiesterase [Alistipes sp.]|nr:glycerophosphodiester phosphodiesterase [Alistipes sp.]
MKKLISLLICLCMSGVAFSQTQVIAHRGFHAKGNSYDNTISSLKNAQELGVYGSEVDIHETSDGVLIAIHGMSHRDIKNVQKATFEQIRNLPLTNGETVPTLDEYLEQAKKSKTTKLIIEIKSHPTPEQELRVVKNILNAVKSYKLRKRVEYIAFSKYVCDALVEYAPKRTQIAYLNGDLTPAQCHELGYTGIDYNVNVLKAHPEWIEQCHNLGMKVNVWTVNDTATLQWFIDKGVDYITTDNPLEANRLLGK